MGVIYRSNRRSRCIPNFQRSSLNLCILILALTVAKAAAGDLTGQVTEAGHGTPLAGTRIVVLDEDGLSVGEAVTDHEGRFLVTGLASGLYTVVFECTGFSPARLQEVRATDTPADDLMVVLYPSTVEPEVLVVTASRRPEQDLQAPASTSVIEWRDLDVRSRFTPVDMARDVTGIDFASKGLVQHTFATRGVRGAMSSGMLVLTDQRYAGLPVIDFNLPYLIPLTEEDVERIEIVRGPGAALYGPNSDQGIMHIITTSPLDKQGTAFSLTAGERSLFQGTFRHSQLLSDNVAIKLSGEYFAGDDWEYVDPVEAANREDAIEAGADPDTLRIGRRDFGIEKAAGEARLDARVGDGGLLVFSGGAARTTNVDQANTVGGVQAQDWSNAFLQTRFEHGRLNVNAFWNTTDSGDTYALRTGLPIVDQSRVLAIQARHGTAIAGRHEILYGVDARRSDPRTGGTIHGANEDDDITHELGAYLTGTSTLSSQWDLVGAVRVDYHDRINDLAVSPRLGVVYKPTPEHAIRLTWNKAFSSPSANDLFIDFPVDELNGMAVRLRGIPQDGYQFTRQDGTYLMRSPMTPGGVAEALPADATLTWDTFFPQYLAMLEQVAPDIADQLQGLSAPDAAQVATDLGILDPRAESPAEAFVPLQGSDIDDVPGDSRVITDAIELGYKGRLGSSVSLAVDVYRTHVTDFYGELYAVTPSVMFDEETLSSYFETEGGLSPEEAAFAAGLAGMIPVGTVAPDGQTTADVLMANRQGGEYTVWGSDFAVAWRISQTVELNGTYSWISENMFLDQPQVGVMCLSVPLNKGSLGLQLRDDRRGFDGYVRARAVEGFPVISGVYVGDVPSYFLADLGVGWRISSRPDVHLNLNVSNLLDDHHQEFVGAPNLGRLVTSRLRVRF